MPPHIYHLLHLVGVIFLFVGIGSLLSPNGNARTGMKFHGIGLLILLIAGFGSLAKLHLSYTSPRVIIKLLIWLALGLLPILARRRALQPGVVVIIAVALGSVAAYLGTLTHAESLDHP